jgi:protein subunit release factor B
MFLLKKNIISNTIASLISNVLKSNRTVVISQRNYSPKSPNFPPLNESEIRELFVKGTGPGGQKVNKATNRCELKHLPTGNHGLIA